MSAPRRRSKQQRKRSAAPPPQQRPDRFWSVAPEPPEPERVEPSSDPTALLRSLGTPPLTGQGAVADHYLAAVVERASGLATALAAAADLLADEADDEGTPG